MYYMSIEYLYNFRRFLLHPSLSVVVRWVPYLDLDG